MVYLQISQIITCHTSSTTLETAKNAETSINLSAILNTKLAEQDWE